MLILGLVACATTAKPPPTPRATPTPPLSRIRFDDLKSMAVVVSYDDLFRNNQVHVGKIVYYQGKLIQVIEGGKDSYQLLVDVTRGEYFWTDTVFLHYLGSRLLENDIIEFVGKVNGLITYESIFREVTIPEVTIIQSRLVSEK
jgi:hypothetical protein